MTNDRSAAGCAPVRAMSAPIDSRPASRDLSGTVIATDALVATLTVSQLRRVVADAAMDAFERATAPRGDWMTRKEVAQMVGYKESYLSELVRRRSFPAHQPSGPGSRLMFRRTEVEAWIADQGKR